jgi:hypothetical protein
MVKTGQPGLAVRAMADAPPLAVVLVLVPPGKVETPRWRAPVTPTRRPPLPLIQLADRRKGTAIYGMTTLAANGRLADSHA